MTEQITIDKLVHGGQAIGRLSDGRTVFVWGALPGEVVTIRLTKNKKTYAEGVVESVEQASLERVEPRDDAYLSTSPWQILSFDAEHVHKKEILSETMQREGVHLPSKDEFVRASQQWHYRNKMEYSFWGDESGLHLALFKRGSHNKDVVMGSSIAMPQVDISAEQVRAALESANIRASQLKTIVVRTSQAGSTVAALFVKDESFPRLDLPKELQGLSVVYSNPKSPASVFTRELYALGNCDITDVVCGSDILYGVHSFFQVHIAEFEKSLSDIKVWTDGVGPIVDMYAGVGAMSAPLNATAMVEIDLHNIPYARKNVSKNTEIIHASSEDAAEYIPSEGTLIVDPPRAGLHKSVVRAIISARPKKVVYLSCNPSTQARDLALLQDTYELESLTGYNFFPRTPHIESLALLRLRS